MWASGEGNHHMVRTDVRCLFVTVLLSVLPGYAGEDDGTARMQAYLRRNSAVVLSAPDGTFKIPSGILDDGIDRYRIILTGEVHGMAINYRLRRAFLSYLKKTVDFKYLLLERGPSLAGTLNRYLETGDTTLLDEMYSYFKGTCEWTQESYALWQHIYAFNSALPPEKRLTCVGIDIEHLGGYSLAYLRTLLPDDIPPERISAQIDLIPAFSRDDTTHFDIVAKLWASIEANTPAYERYLGEDFFEFKLIVENMVAAREAYRARQGDGGITAFQRLRDRSMYTNFLQQYERLPAGVYWGHFGHGHIFHKRSEDIDWLGVHLESDGSPVAGRVLSITFAYENSTAMIRRGGGYGTMGPVGDAKPGLFDFYEGPDPILFKLNGKDPPACSSQLVTRVESGGSAEYFDYLLLIRGATPTQPLHVSDEQD